MAATQIHHEINDNLTWAVIGDFTAAISLYYWNIVRRYYMRLVSAQPKRKYRRVFYEPVVIRRIGIARVRKCADGIESLLIGLKATVQDDWLSGRSTGLHRPLV